ncbi:hypothetical protein EGW08_015627, partial [Elysia chlorotica]
VRAHNSAGWGAWSRRITVVTKTAVRPIPLALMQTAASTTCIRFQWAPPIVFDEIVAKYKIQITANDEAKTNFSSIAPKEARQHEQCGLTPYTQYTVGVSVMRDTGHTGQAIARRMWTEGLVPPKPRKPIVLETTETTMSLELYPVIFDFGPLTGYEIRILRVYHNHSVNLPHPFELTDHTEEERIPLSFLEPSDNSPSSSRFNKGQEPNIQPFSSRSGRSSGSARLYFHRTSPDKVSTNEKFKPKRHPFSSPHYFHWSHGLASSAPKKPNVQNKENFGPKLYSIAKLQEKKRLASKLASSSKLKSTERLGSTSPSNPKLALKKETGLEKVPEKEQKDSNPRVSLGRKKRSFTNPPGVLWLELMPYEVAERTIVVIGSGKVLRGQPNMPLAPDSEYAVVFVAKSTVVDITKHSYTFAVTTAFTKPSHESVSVNEHLLWSIIAPIAIVLFFLMGFFVIRYVIQTFAEKEQEAKDRESQSSVDSKSSNSDDYDVDRGLFDDSDALPSAYDDDGDNDASRKSARHKKRDTQVPVGNANNLESFFNRASSLGQPRYITTMRDNIMYTPGGDGHSLPVDNTFNNSNNNRGCMLYQNNNNTTAEKTQQKANSSH